MGAVGGFASPIKAAKVDLPLAVMSTTFSGKDAFTSSTLLIVDDFAAWRTCVRQILGGEKNWNCIYEACDGREAVQAATNFQPNVIVLDIGVPELDGIEAAKVIRENSPNSRIVFLSLSMDDDIRHEALSVSGASYVPKLQAANTLCDTVMNVLSESQSQSI